MTVNVWMNFVYEHFIKYPNNPDKKIWTINKKNPCTKLCRIIWWLPKKLNTYSNILWWSNVRYEIDSGFKLVDVGGYFKIFVPISSY